MATVQEFITRHGIGIASQPVPANPNMHDDGVKMNHWHCVLTRAAPPGPPNVRTMQLYYSMGLAHVEKRKANAFGGHGPWVRVCETVPHSESVFDQRQRLANTRPARPDAVEVLDCLRMDANSEFNSFEEWASDYGYSTDSRAAERTYEACKRQRATLYAWLGASLFSELMNCEEC